MSQALSLIGWTFLPDMATRFLQNLYYNLTIRAGSPRPQPGHPRWAEHYRRTYILVVCIYLAFTIYEADWDLQRPANRDYYSLLGVLPSASAREIKRRYRQLSAVMHPDKISSAGGAESPFNVEQYLRIQTAHAVLSDDVKRFAYDRFGPAIHTWTECTVVRDFAMRGARELISYYAIGLAALYVFPKLGYFREGIYWRYIAFAALLVFELHTITRAGYPWLLEGLVNPVLVNVVNPVVGWFSGSGGMAMGFGMAHPPYLPFQAIAIARRMSITLSIALNQVLPFLTADTRSGHVRLRKQGSDEAKTKQSLDELEKTLHGVHEEAKHMVQLEVTPFVAAGATAGAGEGMGLRLLRERVKRWLVDNTMRNDPMTKAAIHARITRRREGVPAGAQGNGMRMRGGNKIGNGEN